MKTNMGNNLWFPTHRSQFISLLFLGLFLSYTQIWLKLQRQPAASSVLECSASFAGGNWCLPTTWRVQNLGQAWLRSKKTSDSWVWKLGPRNSSGLFYVSCYVKDCIHPCPQNVCSANVKFQCLKNPQKLKTKDHCLYSFFLGLLFWTQH